MTIPNAFLAHASDVLADTRDGLTGTEIARYFRGKSVDYGVDAPHVKAPFTDLANKRTAFLKIWNDFHRNNSLQLLRN